MNTSTALIIGGGVIGLSTAYHLARRNFGKIIILEKEQVGDGSSSRAAGIITGLMWSDAGVLVRKRSLQLFNELAEELAPNGYTFHDVGCLNIFDATSWPERESYLPIYDRHNAPYKILTAADINQRWPELTLPDDQLGLYDPLGGYSEPHEYIPALRQQIRAMGVEILEGNLVTGFLERNGHIAGVQVRSGRDEKVIEADAVISTVHVWTLQLLAEIGINIPAKAFVHQRYVSSQRTVPFHLPAVNANPQGGYLRPAQLGRSAHRVLAGYESADRLEYTISSSDFRMTTLSAAPHYQDKMTANLSSIMPSLHGTTWEDNKVGLISFAIDGEPLLGPVPSLPGLFVGASFHSGGFAYNPAAGELLAEYILNGETSIDVSTFSPQRFAPENFDQATASAYLASTIPQSQAIQRRH